MPRGFELNAKLSADGTHFFNTMQRAKATGESFAATLKNHVAGAFSTAAILTAAKAMIKYGGDVADTAKKLGISTTALQEFEYAAKQNGATLDDVAAGFRGLAKARDDALAGDKGKMNTFAAFGVDEAMLKAGHLEQIFHRIAETVRTTDFGASQLPMVEDVLGRAGGTLIPMMVAGLAEAVEEARKLGVVLGEDVIQSLDEAGDAVDKLTARLRGPLGASVAFFADRLRDIVDFLDIIVGSVGAFAFNFAQAKGNALDKFIAAAEGYEDHVNRVLDERIKADNPPPDEEDGRKKKDAPLLNSEETYTKEDLEALAVKTVERVLRAKPQELPGLGSMYQPQVNELQRIGGFHAGGQSDRAELGKQQATLEKMRDELAQIRQNTAKLGAWL